MTAKEFIFGNRGTQSLIALKMGVGRQAVSNWCTGKNIPTARNIIKMTKALEELGVQTNEAEIFSIFSEIEKKAD